MLGLPIGSHLIACGGTAAGTAEVYRLLTVKKGRALRACGKKG